MAIPEASSDSIDPNSIEATLAWLPPGADWILLIAPEALFAQPSTRSVAEAIFPSGDLEHFALHSGVDLRNLRSLTIAGYTLGTVAIAEGSIDASFAVQEAGERMAPLESRTATPLPRRVGFLGARRVDLTALDDHRILWVEGPPELAGQILARGRAEEATLSPELGQSPARALWRSAERPDLMLVVPGPLGLPTDTGIGLLLAHESSMHLSLEVAGSGVLSWRCQLDGEFPPGIEQNLRTWARSLAASPFGHTLGLSSLVSSLRMRSNGDHLWARASIEPQILSRGLRNLLSDDLEHLLSMEDSASVPRELVPSRTIEETQPVPGEPAPAEAMADPTTSSEEHDTSALDALFPQGRARSLHVPAP